MKNSLIISGIILSLTVMAAPARAEHQEDHQHHESMMMEHGSMMEDSQENSEAVEVGNKICPISGEKVGQMGDVVKFEYNGKIYNLCCPACIEEFKKNPEKYSKIAEEEAAKEKIK